MLSRANTSSSWASLSLVIPVRQLEKDFDANKPNFWFRTESSSHLWSLTHCVWFILWPPSTGKNKKQCRDTVDVLLGQHLDLAVTGHSLRQLGKNKKQCRDTVDALLGLTVILPALPTAKLVITIIVRCPFVRRTLAVGMGVGHNPKIRENQKWKFSFFPQKIDLIARPPVLAKSLSL